MTEAMAKVGEKKKKVIEIGKCEIKMRKTKAENLSASMHPIVVRKNFVVAEQNRTENERKLKAI